MLASIRWLSAKRRTYKLGVIIRATGSQAGKLALIGGRVEREERIDKALGRHLQTDLGLGQDDWKLLTFPFGINTPQRPFYVQQYWPATESEPPYGFDPSKHSIGLTFLINLTAEPKPANEANAFRWVTEQDVAEPAAYNQHLVMQEAFRFLKEAAGVVQPT